MTDDIAIQRIFSKRKLRIRPILSIMPRFPSENDDHFRISSLSVVIMFRTLHAQSRPSVSDDRHFFVSCRVSHPLNGV